MVSPVGRSLSSDPLANAAARGEALDALQAASGWRLAEAGWVSVAPILDAMLAALEGGNLDALQAATADLERLKPERIVKIGTEPAEPPPRVRERLNRLVHALGGASQDDLRGADRDHDSDASPGGPP